MTKELRNDIVRILTEYENPDDFESLDEYNSINWEETFYELLVRVQNDDDLSELM